MTIRPQVQKFAELMEARLREHDHKGGWSKDGTDVLRDRLAANVPTLPAVESCVDVANYAMMLADLESAL